MKPAPPKLAHDRYFKASAIFPISHLYFRTMVNLKELRPGNTVLFKDAGRIRQHTLDATLFAVLLQRPADFFPVVLNAEVLQQIGFAENKKYALLPAAREFILVLPVPGSAQVDLRGYIKNNGECFARAFANNEPISRNVFSLHALEDLYYALTGTAVSEKSGHL